MTRALAAVLVLGGLSACRHAAGSSDLAAQLGSRPGSYVGGSISNVSVQTTLDRRDFVYDLAIDATSSRAAYSHLAAKVYRLGIAQGTPDLLSPTPTKLLSDAPINANELDVEAIAFSPEGQRLAVASRDRTVRLFDTTGAVVASAVTEEALTAVAFAPDGKTIVVGSEGGLLTVFDAQGLTYRSELRAHREALRGLAFDDHGTLWSGGFDRKVRSFTLGTEEAPLTEVRLHPRKVAGGSSLTAEAPSLDGGVRLDLGIDERAEVTMLTPEAADRLGIEVGLLHDHLEQLTPGGKVSLPTTHLQTLRFKALIVPEVQVAICATCVPAGLDGVLGHAFLATHPIVQDEATRELVLHAAEGEVDPHRVTLALHPGATFPMPGFVADLTVSRDGSRLGVALDEAKPERNLAIYQREKAGTVEPQLAGNVAAIVDAKSGSILEKHGPHFGVVSSAAISPDGRSIASGGWDRKVYVFSGSDLPVGSFGYGWAVRKVRFSPDGRLVGVAAWTPQNAQNADSDPAAQLLRLDYLDATILPH